ncbi:serine protease [Corynebacterium sp.]|uniref:trypsin-like serine peptidase n=1 Tax=Corynebacterium sp. TaxID=1720 RepID=UPI0026DCF421|nr:trypsin-like serine protease [Corynebacterium sp.]
MKLTARRILGCVCLFPLLISNQPAAANPGLTYGKNTVMFPEATSTVPVADDRVAALWSVANEDERPRRDCTATHLHDQWWMTARHCIPDQDSRMRVLQNRTHDVAGVEAVYTKSSEYDFVLLKVSDGIIAEDFTLADEPPAQGDYLNVVGYGGEHDYPSLAEVRIEQLLDQTKVHGGIARDVLESRSAGASRTCGGDSGAAVFRGDKLFAIHTAGTVNPSCRDGEDSRLIHTSLHPHVDWITQTTEAHAESTETERSLGQDSIAAFIEQQQ